MIFAYYLFPPLYSLRVAEVAARENLSWMVLSAIALSYLLFPTSFRAAKDYPTQNKESTSDERQVGRKVC